MLLVGKQSLTFSMQLSACRRGRTRLGTGLKAAQDVMQNMTQVPYLSRVYKPYHAKACSADPESSWAQERAQDRNQPSVTQGRHQQTPPPDWSLTELPSIMAVHCDPTMSHYSLHHRPSSRQSDAGESYCRVGECRPGK